MKDLLSTDHGISGHGWPAAPMARQCVARAGARRLLRRPPRDQVGARRGPALSMWWRRVTAGALVALAVGLLGGCASVPTTPSVMVLPGRGKTFEEFQADDATCRRSATQAVQQVGSDVPTQYRFDMAYMQCMYASGHQVPGSGGRS